MLNFAGDLQKIRAAKADSGWYCALEAIHQHGDYVFFRYATPDGDRLGPCRRSPDAPTVSDPGPPYARSAPSG